MRGVAADHFSGDMCRARMPGCSERLYHTDDLRFPERTAINVFDCSRPKHKIPF